MSNRQRPEKNIADAIAFLAENEDHLRWSDIWRLLWGGVSAKKALSLGTSALLVLSSVAIGSWHISSVYHNATFEPAISPAMSSLPDGLVQLKGTVESVEGVPLENYNVALIEEEFGPFTDSFVVAVPVKSRYTILVTPENGTYPVRFWRNAAPDDELNLGTLGGFPDNSGVVQGQVFHPEISSLNSIVEVDGATGEIDQEGNYRITDIPVGNKHIIVKDIDSDEILFQHPIELDFSGPTPFDIRF